MSEEKTIIFTTNEEEYCEAMKILDKLGYKWLSGAACEDWGPSLSWIMKTLYLTLHEDSKTITVSPTKPDLYPLSLKVFEQLKGTESSFTKADLEDGMIMKTRDGRYYMYLKKYNRGLRHEGFISLDDYDDDLTCYKYISDYDIVAVYNPKDLTTLDFALWVMYHDPIWKRPEKVRMTLKEIEEKLGIKNLEIIKEEEFDE